ncbi:oxidative stress-induced growth inhibitor 1-like [Leptidea sinapis]|uniref:oxidative stress-induced growth inhibitor 1-like n=1 Tax=Leptidea sinapis TaxID=189913 RepID=UPI00213F3C1A|nr:oxidative stress-induced growth inhibitor 1-like [Leptidea sinapis]XP_050671599.1 oxidative stress-induced growth inhibitor 1-like [Leptidea sinapis]
MRDGMKTCQHTLTDDVIYKEVVVIGNGPSGLVTSFMLAGNVPYLKEIPEDLPIDEMLKARLSNLPPGQNLYETDLLELADGLEGRSQNPIPLLLDNLLRPCADLGIQADPLIEWRFDANKEIEHVVLGRGAPGGSWHTFPPDVRTLSPAAWLTLPPHCGGSTERLSARAVAAYCRRYVHSCHLQRYFRCNVVVSSVTPVSRVSPPCCPACPRNAAFCVTGYDKCEGRGFRYLCRRVVVACGANERPNSLCDSVASFALHSLHELESALRSNVPEPNKNILVVGSGVSAADAVRMSLAAGFNVLHAHRAPAESLAKLSPLTYPDYCRVYKMMCDGPSAKHPNYTPYPDHAIVDVSHLDPQETPPKLTHHLDDDIRPKRVKLLNLVTNQTTELTVFIIAVFIGSKPDLFFLQTNFDINNMDVKKCKCHEKKIDDSKCFFKNHWHYFKSVLGQSIQSCKSRYLNYTEINGNIDTKCELPDCQNRDNCTCETKAKNGLAVKECKCEVIPYSNFTRENTCQCQTANPYSSGLGFGVDPKKPVDGRSNPVAIDKSTHEMLNAPKGMYALGPLTADNFIRFIPGGALAIVSQIHKEIKAEQ